MADPQLPTPSVVGQQSSAVVGYAPEIVQPKCFAQRHGCRCQGRANVAIKIAAEPHDRTAPSIAYRLVTVDSHNAEVVLRVSRRAA